MNTIDPNGPAFPVPAPSVNSNGDFLMAGPGITLRAYFAGLALQGLLSNSRMPSEECGKASCTAVRMADALIAELNKPV